MVAGASARMAFGRSRQKPLKRPDQRMRGRLPRRLARWRRAARLLLIFEVIWPILWPPAGILGAYLCAALLGLPLRLGRPLNTLLALGDITLAAIALGIGVWRIRWPDDAAARHRLQSASGLAHDPIAALEDTPAQTDAVSVAVWQIHRQRSIAAAKRLRLRLPWPWLTRRDRILFRGGLAGALIVCALIAGPAARTRLGAAFTFDFALLRGGAATPPAITAWVTPPAYTGRAPLLLPGHDAALSLPAGSRLTVTLSGVGRIPKLLGAGAGFHSLDADSYQLDTVLIRSGRLTLRGGGERLARWSLTVLPDQPPTIAFAGQPGPDQGSANLRLGWHAGDDYGVVSAQMTAHLIGHPMDPGLTLPLALPDGPAPAIAAVQVADLTANPWAGLPVIMRLADRDATGQQGASPRVTLILPERRFADAQARAVIAIRKGLVLMPQRQDPHARAAAAQAIFAVGAAAMAAGKPAQAVLPLMATGWLLADEPGPSAVPAAIDQLWQVALHFEQGDAADSAQALERANDALKTALQSPSTTPAALARLMEAVQAAVVQHLSTLMQMAQHQGGSIGAPPSALAGGPSLDLSQLARQMRAMEAAAKAGDMQAMRQDLAALEQSLQALEQARVVKPDPAQAAARAQAMKDLASLQSMMRRQGQLMDHSGRRAEAETPDPAGDARDAQAQAQLRQALAGLSSRLGSTIKGAGQAMGQAVQQLQGNQDAGAAAAQQKAVLALQQAANALGRRLSQQSGQGGAMQIGGMQPGEQPGGQDGFSQGDGATDPLGRPLTSGQGASLGADVTIPDGSGQARLRAILRDLRDKAGDRSLTPSELDYIQRLLQPF
jgi:tetratricopeptide (TPR) repeat protein